MHHRTVIVRAASVVILAIVAATAFVTTAGATTNEGRSIKFFDVFVTDGVLHATGKVVSKHDVQGCEDKVPVKLQKMKSGEWRKVARGRTDSNGFFDVFTELPVYSGEYRAVAPAVTNTFDTEMLCRKAISPTKTVS